MAKHSRSKTVLMIEDDELLAQMYQLKFKLEGYTVLLAHSAADAKTLLDQHTPDLVVLDILLPKVNGLSVLKDLRKNPKTMHCPVIILTNLHSSEIDMSQEVADALGVVAYLIKSKVTPQAVLSAAALATE